MSDVEALVRKYVAVWEETDPERRRAAIADLWAEDGVEFVEGARFRGFAELEERVAGAYKAFVETGDYNVTSADDVSVHQDIVTFTIQLVARRGDDAGQVGWAARVFILLGDGDRIKEDYHLTVKPLPAQ